MGAKWGVLMLLGFMMIILSLMWDSSIGMAWEDLNNSVTDVNSTQHAAVSSGRLFSTGYGAMIAAFGFILMVGAVIALFLDSKSILGGR